MTAQRQVYVCGVCGNIVEVLRAAGGTLTCCDQAMTLAEENTTDAAQEKHATLPDSSAIRMTILRKLRRITKMIAFSVDGWAK